MMTNMRALFWNKLLGKEVYNLFSNDLNKNKISISDIPVELLSQFPVQSAAKEKGILFQLFSPSLPENMTQDAKDYFNAGDWLFIGAYSTHLPHARMGSISCRISADHFLISGVDVKESYRGRGIMKLLMGHAMSIAARLQLTVELDDNSRGNPSFLDDSDSYDQAHWKKVLTIKNRFEHEFKNPYDIFGFTHEQTRKANLSKNHIWDIYKGFFRINADDSTINTTNTEQQVTRERSCSF